MIQKIVKFYCASILILIVLLLHACSTQKVINHTSKRDISKVIYDYYYEFPADAEISLEEYQDTLIANFQRKYNLKLNENELKIVRLLDVLKETPRSEIHVEFSGDTIWRYKTYDQKTKSEISRLDLENGIYHLQKTEKQKSKEVAMHLFEGDSIYIVQEFPKIREKVLGFSSHKVLIKGCTMSFEEFPYSMNNSVFEIYVTDKIDIPLHAIVPINKRFEGYFPLKIRIWGDCDGIVKVYQIKEILYN